MTVRPILTVGHPVLREPARDVSPDEIAGAEVQTLIDDLIETMRFDPDTGVPRLELHLARIKASAAELGFSFDRHETRNRIQALCFELEAPTKLRLLLARSGEISLETSPLPPPQAVGTTATAAASSVTAMRPHATRRAYRVAYRGTEPTPRAA